MTPKMCLGCGNWQNVGGTTLTMCTCNSRLCCNDCGEYGHTQCRKGRWPDAAEDNPSIGEPSNN